MENNIILTNEVIREKLNEIEKKIDKKNIKYYDEFYNIIAHDNNYILYLDIMFLDSYLSLNYKSKTGFITNDEELIYKKLELIFLDEYMPYIEFKNNRDIRNSIIDESSKYRQYSKLTKSKIIYMLEPVDKGILSNIRHVSIKELSNNKLSIDDIIDYICLNPKSSNIAKKIYTYFGLLYFYDKENYINLSRTIRKKLNKVNITSNTLLTEEEIKEYITIINNTKINSKINCIVKRGSYGWNCTGE